MADAKILIVEDEGIEALDIQQRLISLGYPSPDIVFSGEDAVTRAEATSPDMVLMDIMLRGEIDGVTAAEQIHARFDIPIIYVTAYADDDTLQRAKITEPYGYIVKPFKDKELRITIDMALYKHQTERKLRESEELEQRFSALLAHFNQFGAIFDSLDAILYVADMEHHKLLYLNKYGLDLFGADSLGKPCFEVLQAGQTARCPFCTNDRLVRDGVPEPAYVRETLNRLVGRWFLNIDKAIIWDDGRLVRMAVAVDITDRKRAEEELQSRARLATLAADVGVALTQGESLGEALQQCAEAMVRNLDAAFARIWTLNEDEGMLELLASAGMYTHTDGAHSRMSTGSSTIGRIASERQPLLINVTEGSSHFADPEWAQREGIVAFAGYPLVIENRPVGVMAMFARHLLTDFTLKALASVADEISLGIDRKRADEALRETTRRLQALVQASPLAINVIDRDGNVTRWNPACERLFGWSEEEVLGQPNPTLPEKEREGSQRLVKESLEGKMFSGLELERRRKDGSAIEISLSTAPLFDADRNVIASMGIIADITERKRLEKFREGYVYTISHDLRNPLAAIQGLAQFLLRKLEKAGSRGSEWQIAQDIITSAERMNAIIQDLLDSARLEVGQVKLDREPLYLEAFVAGLLERSAQTLIGRQVRVDVPADLPHVSADPNRLERILMNLLTNATKYSPPASEVVVGAERTEGEITVFVTDQGCGIAPEELPNIFDRFYRGKGIGKTEGLGLGLDIAKGLVEAHGGRIWAESVPSKGSTFYFTLPLV